MYLKVILPALTPRRFGRCTPPDTPKASGRGSSFQGVKFQLALKLQLRKDNPNGSEEYKDPVLRHKQEPILQVVEIVKALDKAFPTIQETLEKWIQRGSGWVVDKVMTLRLDIARYQPLRSGSYIPLHAKVAKKNRVGIAVLDVKKQR